MGTDDDDFEDSECYISGWGRTTFNTQPGQYRYGAFPYTCTL